VKIFDIPLQQNFYWKNDVSASIMTHHISIISDPIINLP